MKVRARNGRMYMRDHPHEVISPYVMRFEEIRTHLKELSTNPDYGWTGYGGRAGLERALGMAPRTLKDKLDHAWIWPGPEQQRLTHRIRDILEGRIVPRRFAANRVEGVLADPPQPPKLSEKPRVLNFHVTIGPHGPHLHRVPGPKPTFTMPNFKEAFKDAIDWNHDSKRR
jgi:hypothetical protein